MMFFDAMVFYRDQIKRKTGLKCLLAPVTIKEAGPVVKVALRRPLVKNISLPRGEHGIREKTLKLIVSIEGSIESETGLKNCLDASEALQVELCKQRNLENALGEAIPNTRITFSADENDSVLEDPENGAKAWDNEVFYIEITIP